VRSVATYQVAILRDASLSPTAIHDDQFAHIYVRSAANFPSPAARLSWVPNLEQLGLVQVDYRGLDDLAADEARFA
jgi:hypothetical protein